MAMRVRFRAFIGTLENKGGIMNECQMSRYLDCVGPKGTCETLDVVLCEKHHAETHRGITYPLSPKLQFDCKKKGAKTS